MNEFIAQFHFYVIDKMINRLMKKSIDTMPDMKAVLANFLNLTITPIHSLLTLEESQVDS